MWQYRSNLQKDATFSNVSVEYTGTGRQWNEISVAVGDSFSDFLRVSIKSRIIRPLRKQSSFEYGRVNGHDFEVSDNVTTEVKIPVRFQ